MPTWALVVVGAALVAASTWITRRILGGRVGAVRATVTAAVVVALSAPVALSSLESAGVSRDGRLVVAEPLAVAFLLLTIGWVLVAVVVAVSVVEFLWPTRAFVDPVTRVRGALARRDRMKRYSEIVAIASRHGLDVLRSGRGATGAIASDALVAALNDAGVTFVKLGQVLSTRNDLFAPETIRALSTLQTTAVPIPWSEARAVIQAELPRPMDEVFHTIEETPLAAASVAQVHAATLVSGERVVVKVQRPAARAEAVVDLDILHELAADAERRLPAAREIGVVALAAEFSRALEIELDYRVEARNTEMLRRVTEASESRRIRIPRIFEEFSTERLLVQERAEGTPFAALGPHAADDDDAVAICDELTDAIFQQVAVHGVFHADLHPGNLLLAEDGTVTLIDFGAIGIVPRSIRRLLLPMLIAVAHDDDQAATDAVLLLCEPAVDGSHEQRALQADLGVVLTRLRHDPGENLFRALVEVLRAHRMAIPPSMLLVLRTLGSLEGTLRRLSPGYDMTGRGIARAGHFALATISPLELVATSQTRLALAVEQLSGLPRRLATIGRKIEDGTFAVRVQSVDTAGGRGLLDAVIGRVVTAGVGIALVVVGALLLTADSGPLLTPSVPAFAFLGSVAGLGGMLLLLRSLRETLRRRG